MTPQEKNKLSHRGRAMAEFRRKLAAYLARLRERPEA